MTETIDDTTIINRALGRLGAGSITGLDEDTDLARQVMSVYPDLVDFALTGYHWTWARRTVALDRQADAPNNGWRYGFNFPPLAISQPERLMTNPRGRDNPLREFSVEGKTVFADEEALFGTFIVRVSPDEWPAGFRAAFTVWLASALAVPVTHDANLKSQLEQEAFGAPSQEGRGGLMGRAIGMDAAGGGGGSPLLASDPLTSARFDGPWHGDF